MNKISRKGFLKIAAAAAMSGVTAGALAACNAASGSTSTAASGNAAASGATGTYIPGTYEGTALGFGDDITVQITISGGQMTDITVLQHDGEDKPYYTQALTMLDKMLTAQTGDVDIVSGATLTCEGLRDAVQDALGKAAA